MPTFDIAKAFLPSISPFEIIIRGTFVYVFIFILLRIVLKRQSGTVSINDLLVLVLIADAAQNAMAGPYTSVVDGLLLVSTIIFWSYFVDWLGYRFKWLERFIEPPPLLLIRNGKMLLHNMRKELVTENELLSQLREQGIDDISRVREAFIEPDGNISVITEDRDRGNRGSNKKKTM